MINDIYQKEYICIYVYMYICIYVYKKKEILYDKLDSSFACKFIFW